MFDDPDLTWEWQPELGMFGSTYDPIAVLTAKVKRCIELDRVHDDVRSKKLVDADKLRSLHAQRVVEYRRLLVFLRKQASAVLTMPDKQLRSFLTDLQAGKRIPEEVDLGESPRDALSWLVDLSGGTLADERLKRRTTTFLAFPMPRASVALAEAWDCWTVGLFLPATVMCRAVLDHALRELFDTAPWFEVPAEKKVPMSRLVDSCPHLSDAERETVRSIKEAADNLLHCRDILSTSGEEETYEILIATGRLLKRLAGVRRERSG